MHIATFTTANSTYVLTSSALLCLSGTFAGHVEPLTPAQVEQGCATLWIGDRFEVPGVISTTPVTAWATMGTDLVSHALVTDSPHPRPVHIPAIGLN